ncbi:MAG: hypothetical protein A3F44_01565 [Candidatus Doudnabacteria bacterium RIFCSPHIGHO2_12_FULL_47_25]|nr:MAG: hypothetical protein A3F44_01565 [Candidatus Doudnabacteria bacterium RIFCSPHIGHO2_12_FULL_47_25]
MLRAQKFSLFDSIVDDSVSEIPAEKPAKQIPARKRSNVPAAGVLHSVERKKQFLDIPTAAELAGFSIRHFRRIMDDDKIPIMQIGHKFFILGRDFNNWEASKKSTSGSS